MPSTPNRIETAGERRKYEADYEKLAATLATGAASSLVHAFMALESRLDAGLMEAKSALLVSGLLTTEEDEALGAWIYQQHSNLARMGHAIAAKALAEGRDQVKEAMWTVALSLLHWGEAVKWELMVGRLEQRDYAMLHDLARMAMREGRLEDRGTFTVEGLERTASIEALYFRTLLLDRYTSGNLTRQQIEVLDAWLWEWSPSLVAAREPHGAVMRADLDRDQGLRYGPREGGGESLYLALAPLEAQRGAVISEFHAGRIVPARGPAAEIRIEALVAVLIQLRRAFSGDESRAPRRSARGRQVEAWFGLTEITARLLLEENESAEAGMAAKEPAATRRAGDLYDEVYDKPRRWLALVDESDTGWLVEATTANAAPLLIGELVALRLEEGGPCHVARVVRRVREPGTDRVQVGIQLLSNPATRVRPCALRSAELASEDTYIFLPGPDASGLHDTFIVPFRLLESRACFHVRRGGQDFALEFNRVRKRGRGWAQAGFEMVDPKLEYLVA
jgi:hypothetical protein